MSFHVPNHYRLRGSGLYASDERAGNNGAFYLPHPNASSSLELKVIASDGAGWEHVSVSLPSRCPTWPEMCYVKGLFWDEDDCVVQFHPPGSEYVNNHRFCLHMWRPTSFNIPTPDAWMVGYKSIGVLA